MHIMDEKVIKIFSELFEVPESDITDDMSYNSFAKWDSLEHLELVSKLEGAFDIDIDMDDVIAMENVGKAKEIVNKYLNK